MRAMTITKFGSPNVLQLAELDTPTPGPGEVLIEVHAAALNPVDTKIRRGLHGKKDFPLIPGYDCSGVITQVGDGVEHLKAGDEVFASPSLVRHGAHAEFVVVDARTIARKPEQVDHQTAAAFPLVTLTAWEALHEKANLHEGETALIHAGAGGVGHIAVQLAKLHGCTVITTASTDTSIDFCKSLGADHVLNYKTDNVVQRVMDITDNRGCDVVMDTVGGDTFDLSLDCVGPLGRLVGIVLNENARIVPALFRKSASLHLEFMGAKVINNINVESQGEILATAAEMIDAGKLTTRIHKTYPLDELPDAHKQQESAHVAGKIIIKIRD